MDERPIDLTPLDPTLDGERWERRIAAIARLAAPELARRAASAASPELVLLGWFRPALSAAAVLALCAGGALAMFQGAEKAPGPAAAVDALRLPAPVALWLDDQPPTVADLALAVQGGEP
ncbi:MAG TPA: hypothetical protein VGX68_07810 [Thermoanaerobaculia bacterium]|jgi:hypothetical protein|nr:hypothetical protein [Thermoanaerobaculia bacterium]